MIKELEAVRAARKEKDRLWMEYQALIPTPKSQRLDGMPGCGSGVDFNALVADLRSEAEQRYKYAADRFCAAERAARAQMGRLTPLLYSLCLFYYIGGMSEKETQGVMHISESTFKRYRADLKKYDPNMTPL